MKDLDSVSVNEKRDFAYELKFLLPIAQAEFVLAWAARHLSPDPHVNTSAGDSYRVNSLYFDTANLDVYHRIGSYARCKYRLRRYAAEKLVFLERKLKSRGLVGKRRTRVSEEDLSLLGETRPSADWPGYWFHRRLLARQLLPRCQITYTRVACVGSSQEGPVRLTLDRGIRSVLTAACNVLDPTAWTPLLTEQCILELKFRETLPALFKMLIEELSLIPQAVSKYRLSIQAFGLASTAEKESAVSGNGHATAEMTALTTRNSGAPGSEG
jgi:hypothetical protein